MRLSCHVGCLYSYNSPTTSSSLEPLCVSLDQGIRYTSREAFLEGGVSGRICDVADRGHGGFGHIGISSVVQIGRISSPDDE